MAKLRRNRFTGPPMMFTLLAGMTALGVAGFVLLLVHGAGVWAVVGMAAAVVLALAGVLGALLLAMILDGFKNNLR
ncbi:hypothetical protein ACFYUY_22155 [Kitasatospora sp. NPDC004745]|uniref:hypothetical protein n=1 Tax=unclassified Kitasatospora TaxID=2633591 RepID=UPI0033F82990